LEELPLTQARALGDALRLNHRVLSVGRTADGWRIEGESAGVRSAETFAAVVCALAAGALGAVPLVDVVAVPTLQAKMLHSVAEIYRQPWDQQTIGEFLGLLGVGIGLSYAARLTGRWLIKLVPGFGQTVGAVWGASTSATMTYALGKAADVYFQRRLLGQTCEAEMLREVFNAQLIHGGTVLKQL